MVNFHLPPEQKASKLIAMFGLLASNVAKEILNSHINIEGPIPSIEKHSYWYQVKPFTDKMIIKR